MKTCAATVVSLRRLLGPAILFVLGWSTLFLLMRLVLIGVTWSHHGDADLPLMLRAFGHGARFDLSVAAKLAAVFVFWTIWRRNSGPLEKRLVFALFALVAFLSVFALVAEVEFYKEFEERLGSLAFEFFSTKSEHNAIILGMIWHGYPVVRWMLACVVIWGLFVWFMRPLLMKAEPCPAPPGVRAAAMLLWAFATVVAARGGFQPSVLRWGDGYFSQNTYANQMAQNGIFTLIDALRHPASKQMLAARWEHCMPVEIAAEVVREITLLPGEKVRLLIPIGACRTAMFSIAR